MLAIQRWNTSLNAISACQQNELHLRSWGDFHRRRPPYRQRAASLSPARGKNDGRPTVTNTVWEHDVYEALAVKSYRDQQNISFYMTEMEEGRGEPKQEQVSF